MAACVLGDNHILLASRNDYYSKIETIQIENLENFKKLAPKARIYTNMYGIVIKGIPTYDMFKSLAKAADVKTVLTYSNICTIRDSPIKTIVLPWAEMKEELR